MAQTANALADWCNFTRPVALHAVGNVGFCCAAAFGASIYVQLGKYAFKQYGIGENG